jgi:PAS domain S-box-containing protein
VVLLLLSAALANRLAKHFGEPLHQLEEQLAQQSVQAVPGPVTISGAAEFRSLARAFNRLTVGIVERRQALLDANRSLQSQIEQRQLAEAALRDSQEKFHKAFNSSPDAIAITTLEEGRYLEVNESFCQLFGYPREEALQMTATQLLYENPGQRAKVLDVVRREGRLRDYELQVRRKNGTIFDASFSVEPVTIQGRPCLIGIARDITERNQAAAEIKRHRDHLEELVRERTAELSRTNLVLATEVHERQRAEDELRQANEHLKELDRLKSEFLSTMSHELRTPLNSIIGFSGILRQRLAGPLTPEQEKQLGIVQSSARHLLGLINDLLDLSRIESGKMELNQSWFRLSGLTDEVIKTLEPLARTKNLLLRLELNGAAAEIYTDRKKVFQILLNLANNAVKFTEQGEVRVLVDQALGSVRFTVQDTGIGIKAEHMGLLFEAFRQVDGSARRVYEGTGLGLYLCKQLAGLLGGEIRAHSEFGKGSEFCFILPLSGNTHRDHGR